MIPQKISHSIVYEQIDYLLEKLTRNEMKLDSFIDLFPSKTKEHFDNIEKIWK